MARGKYSVIAGTFLAGLLVLATGCGRKDWGYLSGTVKLNGQPVGPGSIEFQPTDAVRAGAMASFGEDGNYSVFSSGRKEGAHTGEYKVVISGGEEFGLEDSGPKPKSIIPARYSNPDTTDLKVTIEAGKKVFDFEMKP
jgi:hypothetical protein